MKTCLLASRSRIKAYRVDKKVLVAAEGVLPSPGYKVNIEESAIEIFPPQFDLLRCALPGVFPNVLTPYRHSQTVEYPADQKAIRVAHATGVDEVSIKEPVQAYAVGGVGGDAGADEQEGPNTTAVGFSDSFSFDEAFQNALMALDEMPPGHADQLVTVKVEEIGALFGGLAGFNEMFVRVSRTWD